MGSILSDVFILLFLFQLAARKEEWKRFKKMEEEFQKKLTNVWTDEEEKQKKRADSDKKRSEKVCLSRSIWDHHSNTLEGDRPPSFYVCLRFDRRITFVSKNSLSELT